MKVEIRKANLTNIFHFWWSSYSYSNESDRCPV